jgi:acyl-CoA thioesterase
MRADRFAASCGVRLVALEEGYARATLRLRPEHLNGVGVAQGGAIFTLADLAFAAACNSHGTVAVALDVSVTYVRGATRGLLTAEAREVFLSRKVSVCEVAVTGADGAVVALFRGTAYRKDAAPGAAAGDRRALAPKFGPQAQARRNWRAPRSAWHVYMLRCRDGSLYTGVTNDLDQRVRRHAAGDGSRYTRSRLPVKLVHQERVKDRGSALRREAALKRLKRTEKLALIAVRRAKS